jgi:hypothetical protein
MCVQELGDLGVYKNTIFKIKLKGTRRGLASFNEPMVVASELCFEHPGTMKRREIP